MPSLENLHHYFKEEPFALLAVDVEEKKEIVQSFARHKNLSFRMLLDEDGQVSARYGVRSHPMKFLIDAEGNLIGVAMGYREWDRDEMKSLIQSLMTNDQNIY